MSSDELKASVATPRVESLIERVILAHPSITDRGEAKYFVAVHQELAPLARELEMELAAALAEIERLKAAEKLARFDAVLDAEELRVAVREAVSMELTGVYYCGRTWAAWGVGTMTEDDFTPAADTDEILDGITDAAIRAMRATDGGMKNG